MITKTFTESGDFASWHDGRGLPQRAGRNFNQAETMSDPEEHPPLVEIRLITPDFAMTAKIGREQAAALVEQALAAVVETQKGASKQCEGAAA